MMSRKAPKDGVRPERPGESPAENYLTDAFGTEAIQQQLRALGGDPDRIGERGRALGAEVAARARAPHPAGEAPADHEPAHSQSVAAPRSAIDQGQNLLAGPFGLVAVSHRKQNPSEGSMNRDFEFRQLLRAYRAGVISDQTFEAEVDNLAACAAGPNHEGFRAFGTTYASEREAVIKFLEAVAPAETAGGEAVRGWLKMCKLDCIKGGLKMVAEREAYHGRAFAQRLVELGGTVPQSASPRIRESVDYLCDTKMTDLEKLQKAVMRYPNPEETIRPLFEFADLLKEDQETKEMVKLFAQDELSTLKWQHSLCTVLTEMQKSGQMAAAN
jgi:hypothetical protein